jgi:DNA-binding SARP family transcriptional activator
MTDLRLFLFGEPRLEYDGSKATIHRRKGWALLAYLALAEQRQNRDVLAALLWSDLDQDHARAALRSTLSALATQFPGDWLDTDRSVLALSDQGLWIDVRAFMSLLKRSRTHKHDGASLCGECLDWLKQAVDLYSADFMEGFSIAESADYDDWQLLQREWLRRELSYALKWLATHYGEQQDFETALAYANRWLSLDLLHEAAHRMLMRLYAASGQRAEALRQYRRCVELLDAELATPPESETTELYAAIQAESALSFPARMAAVADAVSVLPARPSLVVGREQSLRDLKSRLGIGGTEMRSVTVIQGWPGVGKSTTVAALAHDREVIDQFPDGILWASLGEVPGVLNELSAWAEALGLSDPTRERKVETLNAQLQAGLRDRRMLLIIDDVWQTEHAMPFLVAGQGCAMILTSRLNDVALALAPTAFDIYRLSLLEEEAALELLGRLTPETVAEYPEAARELVRDLEGLPLAIQVAGRLLHNEARLGWGVGSLLRELHEGAALLEAAAPRDMVKIGQETSPTIAALLRRSTDALDAEMQQRFALLGLFVPKPATFDLGAMAAAWDVTDPKPYARILANRGLLEPLSSGRFQMHALLVLHARALFEGMVG